MASLITSPTRTPFGSLDGARLRNLTNVKNRQNALPVSLSSPIKRRYTPEQPTDSSFEDSENVDPSTFSTKKSKNIDGLPIKLPKTSNFVLKPTNSVPTSISSRQILTPKKRGLSLSTTSKPAPHSAPAGRSPKSKRNGGLLSSRRRISGGSSFTRIDPPSFNLGGSTSLPFSIDAALSGTVQNYTPAPSQLPTSSISTSNNLSTSAIATTMASLEPLETTVPSSWNFAIHEDTQDEEIGNLMEFSTQTLDISDDEERHQARLDRGKENYPPEFHSSAVLSTAHPVTRRDLMTDEPRTPLGDLDASEYYAPGCDANSFIYIEEEDSKSNVFEFNRMADQNNVFQPGATHRKEIHLDTLGEVPALAPDTTDLITPTPSPTETPSEAAQDLWKEIMASVDAAKEAAAIPLPSSSVEAVEKDPNEIEKTEGPIEIWESESAKGEIEGVVA